MRGWIFNDRLTHNSSRKFPRGRDSAFLPVKRERYRRGSPARRKRETDVVREEGEGEGGTFRRAFRGRGIRGRAQRADENQLEEQEGGREVGFLRDVQFSVRRLTAGITGEFSFLLIPALVLTNPPVEIASVVKRVFTPLERERIERNICSRSSYVHLRCIRWGGLFAGSPRENVVLSSRISAVSQAQGKSVPLSLLRVTCHR